ncbi:MAG TPA: response regulator, partial [Dongiaceae bacterium]|nr:response regulator [Dongiaceae bacterium]
MTTDRATILVVDDEPPIRRFLRTTLSAQPYRVVEAATGAEGLSLLRHEKPDLVILDLGLPDLDGLEVLKRIRKESPVPVLILSSRDDEKGKVAAF